MVRPLRISIAFRRLLLLKPLTDFFDVLAAPPAVEIANHRHPFSSVSSWWSGYGNEKGPAGVWRLANRRVFISSLAC